MGLRKGQKELVEQYRGGFCAVPAIPGGGKTHCLSLWAAEMIAQGLHKPGKILIVTYMNSAVNNFKQRIAAELARRGIAGSNDYFVSTIHGLCLQIIKEKPDLAGANEEFEIADGVTKYNIINSAVEEWRRKNEGQFRQFIEDEQLKGNRAAQSCKMWQDRLCGIIPASIGDFKSRGVGPRKARELCSNLSDDSILKCIAEIYEVYDRRLKMEGLMDFDDMLYKARDLLEKDKLLLEKYRHKYSFVCEDEAQDSNLIQSEILTLIAEGNLLRVGDSNQAICGSFSNSDFSLFKNFCHQPETTVYGITQSSRNTRDIIGLANYFVRLVREEHPVPECRESLLPQMIEPVGEEDERQNPVTPEYGIKSRIFESWEEEFRSVVKQALHMTRLHPDKTIAILTPTSWKISDIVTMMESWGMEFEELDNSSGERTRVLRMLGTVIDFLAEPGNSEKLARMIVECLLSVEKTDKQANPLAYKQQKDALEAFIAKCNVEDILYPIEGTMPLEEAPEALRDSYLWRECIRQLPVARALLEYPLIPFEGLILFIADQLGFGREEKAVAQKVASDVRFLSVQDKQFRLKDLSQELLQPKNIFSYFTGVVWELKGYEPRPGVVSVSTYHKSKGLEWDIVFLTGLSYGDFPVTLNDRFIGEYWFLKQQYKNPTALAKSEIMKVIEGRATGDSFKESKIETISERARLLYVGITRARQYLYLSGFHANPGKKNEVLPSRYLSEITKYIHRKTTEGDGRA